MTNGDVGHGCTEHGNKAQCRIRMRALKEGLCQAEEPKASVACGYVLRLADESRK